MAEAFAPFRIQRTIGNLTFYLMEGRNFVRKKSSLTRRKVKYAPCFENTRYNAGLMGQASKIGSFLYKSLPDYWRQSWMYRSFTGEAFTMLKKGKKEKEIKQFLWDRYVQEVVAKKTDAKPVTIPELSITKRPYKKQNTTYWEAKTQKSIRKKARKQERQRNSELLAEASTIAAEIYREVPAPDRNRSIYQQLTGWAMRLLKEMDDDETITEVLGTPEPPGKSKKQVTKQQSNVIEPGYLNCPKGMFYFIAPSNRRLFSYIYSNVKATGKSLELLRVYHSKSALDIPYTWKRP
jgi:hypothetical protein